MIIEREFEFNQDHFEFIREFVRQRTGIRLSDEKREMVYGRLTRRLRALGISSFGEYCRIVREGDEGEAVQLANAITTNVTSFFRQAHHFEYLKSTVLPAIKKHCSDRKRLRIWSAGCSSGEEAYSLAMTVLEAFDGDLGWDVKILATDLDRNVLGQAEAGRYTAEALESVSPEKLLRWFKRVPDADLDAMEVTPALREIVAFRPLNLMHSWPMKGPLDVVFCRNVVIYFDKETQQTLFERFANILSDDGHIFVGHSESLFSISERFDIVGQSAYRRCG